jgi:hypothetical protein
VLVNKEKLVCFIPVAKNKIKGLQDHLLLPLFKRPWVTDTIIVLFLLMAHWQGAVRVLLVFGGFCSYISLSLSLSLSTPGLASNCNPPE